MRRGELLYEGKAKQVFADAESDRILIHFKDDATAFNGVKFDQFTDKGRINCAITAHLLERVADAGVKTHLVAQVDPTTLLCERVEIVPVEVVVRNVVAGSFSKRYGMDEGTPLPRPIVEYFYKSDTLNDPLMGEEVPVVLGWAEPWELACMKAQALRVNTSLVSFYEDLGITLVDFKLEFGRSANGAIVLADEITPDGSRLWEQGTGNRFDKDVFRRDIADLTETYRALYARIFGKELA